MNDNVLFRALILEDVNQKRRDQVKKKMAGMLQKYVDAYTKRRR